ncbi:MAG: tetratricopeptide repeat protein [Desulfuromonadales bacterium]
MSLLKSLFGKSDPVEELGKLRVRQEWAALLAAAKRVERTTLTAEVQAQVAAWEAEAGDRLAQLNLDEGEGALRAGNRLKARDHLQLAVEQARAVELRDRAEQLLSGLEGGAAVTRLAGAGAAAACGSGCGPTCAPSSMVESEEYELDAAGRLELLLATLPNELSGRYATAGTEFLQGWLAAQEGDDARALALFAEVPAAQQEALFHAERGVVLARNGQTTAAEADLRAALASVPELFHPFDALVTLLVVTRRHEELEDLLRQAVAAGRFAGYCWARLAQLEAGRGNIAAALAAGDQALAEGELDSATVLMCADLHEREGRHAEAEALFARLPSGGCGGGAHPLLAEHWLRHGKNLDRALESFKGALRHELDNPRWLLRIAQVYIAKGWKKDAAGPIESLLARGGLPEELSIEVRAAAEAIR